LGYDGLAMPNQIQGIIVVKSGKVTNLKNITDMNAAVVGQGDLEKILTDLTKAGWTLEGDYELRITKPTN
jgi:hypothetical protein